jgi:3-oxoacyl-(acyl-carrier-protein) synthase
LSRSRADAFLVGGGEVLSDPLYLALRKLGVLAEGDRVCIPGSESSQGLRPAEGAAFLVVEDTAFAARRSAKVLAQIVGYGTAFIAPEAESELVSLSQEAILAAIDQALADASLTPADIDVVSAGVNGLRKQDRVELDALRTRFGSDVAIAAPKAILGEGFGAGGAFAMVQAVEWLAGTQVAPLISGRCDKVPRHVLVVMAGFYGNVSAVVLRAPSH